MYQSTEPWINLSSKQNNVHTLLADFVEYCLVNDCQPEEKRLYQLKRKILISNWIIKYLWQEILLVSLIYVTLFVLGLVKIHCIFIYNEPLEIGTGYEYLDLPGLGNNNEKLGLPERLSTGIQFRFRNLFHGKKSGNCNFIC